MTGGTCDSAYRSVTDAQVSAGDYTTSLAGCADSGAIQYRMFWEAPAADLPTSTTAWADGRTSQQWVLPHYSDPNITVDSFSRTNAASNASTIVGTLSGQPATVGARIDVDGNGSFTDPIDRDLGEVTSGTGSVTFHWDGLNGNGTATSTTQSYKVQLTVTGGEAEIHFLNNDMEGRGGVTYTRLNGPNAPQSTINWNDTDIAAAPSTNAAAYPMSGPVVANGIDSTPGVHSWAFSAGHDGSWGNSNWIEDWTSVQRAVPISAVDTLGPLATDASITKTVFTTDARRGDTLHYQITVTNTGTADITSADPLAVGDNLSGLLSGTGDANNITVSTGSTTSTSNSLHWTITSLAVGAKASLDYDVVVNSSAADGEHLINVAYIGAASSDTCSVESTTCAETTTVVTVPAVVTPTPTPTRTATATPSVSTNPTGGATSPSDSPSTLAQTGIGGVEFLLGALAIMALGIGSGLIVLRRRRSA